MHASYYTMKLYGSVGRDATRNLRFGVSLWFLLSVLYQVRGRSLKTLGFCGGFGCDEIN